MRPVPSEITLLLPMGRRDALPHLLVHMPALRIDQPGTLLGGGPVRRRLFKPPSLRLATRPVLVRQLALLFHGEVGARGLAVPELLTPQRGEPRANWPEYIQFPRQI